MSLQKHIKDLIFFYVKTNYNQYLEDHKIKLIPEGEIDGVIENLYDDRKETLSRCNACKVTSENVTISDSNVF